MKLWGNTRCIDGRLFRHDPMPDDPYLETDIGECPECEGRGCEEEAPETIEVNGVWYDRRDTVDALTALLAEARTKNAAYKEVIRDFRRKETAENPTPPPSTADDVH